MKKCGKVDCTTYQSIRLPSDVFEQLYHLPDPVPDPVNDRHYKKFSDCYGTKTSEKHMSSLIVSNWKGHGIPFNLVSQHWNYANLLSVRKTKTCLLQKEGFTTHEKIWKVNKWSPFHMQNNNWRNCWQAIRLWFLRTCKFNLPNTGRGFIL